MTTDSGWSDCSKLLPYLDYMGRWRFSRYTQKRVVVRDGREIVEYREREETGQEFTENQW